jgi:hypothetical protein
VKAVNVRVVLNDEAVVLRGIHHPSLDELQECRGDLHEDGAQEVLLHRSKDRDVVVPGPLASRNLPGAAGVGKVPCRRHLPPRNEHFVQGVGIRGVIVRGEEGDLCVEHLRIRRNAPDVPAYERGHIHLEHAVPPVGLQAGPCSLVGIRRTDADRRVGRARVIVRGRNAVLEPRHPVDHGFDVARDAGGPTIILGPRGKDVMADGGRGPCPDEAFCGILGDEIAVQVDPDVLDGPVRVGRLRPDVGRGAGEDHLAVRGRRHADRRRGIRGIGGTVRALDVFGRHVLAPALLPALPGVRRRLLPSSVVAGTVHGFRSVGIFRRCVRIG